MLAPKKVKYRKRQKGRMNGTPSKGIHVSFGEFGLMALVPGWITARQIEAARVAMTRHVKRGGKIWIRRPDKPITKPAKTAWVKAKARKNGWR
jgi:large subunit ribosomal protein L16